MRGNRSRRVRWASRAFALALLGAAAFAAGPARVAASQEPTAPPPPQNAECVVELVTASGIQMEVWIDGKRCGMSPIDVPLAPGRHVVTAFAPDTFPIVQPFTVRDDRRQASMLADKPLYGDRLGDAFNYLVAARRNHPGNVHVLQMCALLAMERTDFDKLMEMIPEERRSDPMLQIARARWMVLAGDADGALAVLEAATTADPSAAACWRAKAELLAAKGLVAEGRDAAERAVLLDARNPKSFIIRAKVEEADGDARAAELDREHAAELVKNRDARSKQIDAAKAREAAAP